MFFEFRFWKYLFGRNELIASLKDAKMQKFESRVWVVAILGVILFALRDVWGMNTETLTSIFVKGYEDTYSVARIVSLIGAIIWSLLYMAFHFFGIAFLLHKLTNVDLSKVAVLQIFIVALLLMEKALVFFIFSLVGYTTGFSILSFGPLAATFLDNEFIIFFFNQLSLTSGLVVAIQFHFLRAFSEMSSRNLLILLIAIQIILALITAGISLIPWATLFEGGLFA